MDSKDAPASGGLDHADTHFPDPMSPLVGRTEEQRILRDELRIASGGHGRLLLVGGEAGIGKTALVRTIASPARDVGFRILTGSCYDLASTPPYGPWLDLFEACRRDPSLPPAPAAFASGQLAPVDDQGALFADARRFVADLVADRPALIVLEDVHWADPASMDLLRHLGTYLRHWPVLVIVTYRSDAPSPRRSFSQHLPALVREAGGRRVDLHRLDEDALRDLVVSRLTLAGEDEDRLVAYLAAHAEGNPFFATEILRSLGEEQLLHSDGHTWSLGTLDRVVVPPLLRQVIDGRVARLGADTRTPLAVAAVIGYDVSLVLWAGIAELNEGDLFDIVERAVEAHLLEADSDGTRVRFVHALTREALYDGILPPRRRIWHRMVAEALMASPQPNPDTVAFHLQEAGDPLAVKWLIRSGDRAQRAYAWLTAAERFQTAARLMEGVDGQDHARLRLIVRASYLLRFSYPEDALVALDEADRLARRNGDTFTEGEVLHQRGFLRCYTDQFRCGLTMIARGIETLEALAYDEAQTGNALRAWLGESFTTDAQGDPAEDARLAIRIRTAAFDVRRCILPWYLASAGQLAAATTVGDRFVATFGELPGTRGGVRLAMAFAHHGLATAAASLGQPTEAHRLWTMAQKGLDDVDHHVLVAFMLLDELRDVALTYGADDPAMRRRLATEAAAALERAVGVLRPGVSPNLARLRCMTFDGRWEEALRILGELPSPGNTYLRRETTFARVFLARHRGEPDIAWAEIQSLLRQRAATEPGDLIHQEGLFLQREAAGLCLDAGDLPGAEAWLNAHDRWLFWSSSVLGRAEGQLAWGRYHHVAGDTGRARADLDAALAIAASPDQALVRLGAHRLLGEIDIAAGDMTGAESHLATALTLADACDVPFERARTLLALAELRGAAAHVEEASATFAALGAAPALEQAGTLAARLANASGRTPRLFGLTEREMEVLRLVAEGRSNPEIAEALFISQRTAATHVSHILHKLDVGSRAEAVDHAHRHDLL